MVVIVAAAKWSLTLQSQRMTGVCLSGTRTVSLFLLLLTHPFLLFFVDTGEETSWDLTNNQGSQIVNGGNYDNDQSYNVKRCIAQGCYTMTIRDSYGDGLSVGGSNPGYVLRIDGSVEQQAGGNDFGSETSFTFGCGSNPSPTPSPVPNPVPNPTPAPVPSPTPAPNSGSCGSDLFRFDFSLSTDDWGEETSWRVQNSQGSTVLVGGNYGNDQTYTKQLCLPRECYTLVSFLSTWSPVALRKF